MILCLAAIFPSVCAEDPALDSRLNNNWTRRPLPSTCPSCHSPLASFLTPLPSGLTPADSLSHIMAEIEVQEVEIEAIPIQIKEEVYCDGQSLFLSPSPSRPHPRCSDEDSLNQDDDLDSEQMVALHPGEEFIGAEWSNDCDENDVSFPSSAPEVLIETSSTPSSARKRKANVSSRKSIRES